MKYISVTGPHNASLGHCEYPFARPPRRAALGRLNDGLALLGKRLDAVVLRALLPHWRACFDSPTSTREIANDARDRRGAQADENLVYGEVKLSSIATIVRRLLAAEGGGGGKVFVDLGSGSGRAVLAAALLGDWAECRGVELVAALHLRAEAALAGRVGCSLSESHALLGWRSAKQRDPLLRLAQGSSKMYARSCRRPYSRSSSARLCAAICSWRTGATQMWCSATAQR
jgi:hypothetical protein